MSKQFATERFELVKADRVQIANHKFGHNEHGKLDVWIEDNDEGTRFLRQITIRGNTYPMLTGVYTKKCYILCEKATGHYYFLDMNDRGIWLFNENFFGSENFSMEESAKIQQWLANASVNAS